LYPYPYPPYPYPSTPRVYHTPDNHYACVTSVASRFRHAPPLLRRPSRVASPRCNTWFGLAVLCLPRAPSPCAPFSPHIRRVLSLVSRRFCNTAQLKLYRTLEFSPTDVDVTYMHSTACKGAASCTALFASPDDSRKRKTGRSSLPKPNS
jgi:hypothetical protein